jgi:hypothetical protein
MTVSLESTVVGVFSDRVQAGRSIQKLAEVGFCDRQIYVAASHECPDDSVDWPVRTHADSGALMGVMIGTGLGGAIGVALVAGLLIRWDVPEVTGLIATLLVSTAVGATVIGFMGLLIGWGIRKQLGNHYADRQERGGLVVTVQADGQQAIAWAILDSFGAARQ